MTEASLPAVYSEARNALAKCARIDECKSWADRAAALASYAKQADDEQLLNNAKRIKARAIDRIGELAEEIPPAKNQHDAAERARGDAPPSRKQAASDAGISSDQLKTALRVHNVPRDEFERQVESDNPPTITELARQGTKSQSEPFDMLQGRNPKDFQAATAVIGLLTYAVGKIPHLDIGNAIPGMSDREKNEAIKNAYTLHDWLDNLITQLEG
jgi:hypothetical protein